MPGSCAALGGDKTAGCEAAKLRLDLSDGRLKKDPAYRLGWNSALPNTLEGLAYLQTRNYHSVTLDQDGRFQIKNLVPGVEYNVSAIKKNESNFSFRDEGYLHKTRWTVKPGETQDWGDVQVKSFRP